DDEDRGLTERGQVLRLAVAVRVARVGRTDGDPEREEGQERRHEVGAGVHRLGEETEAVRGDAGEELDGDQDARGDDRDESGAALGAHDGESFTQRGGPAFAGPPGRSEKLGATRWRCRRGTAPSRTSRRPCRCRTSGGTSAPGDERGS